jgi:hypothetical protein
VNVTTEPRSTPAPFQPNNRAWLARFNALEILAVLLGIAICSTGTIGLGIGAVIILAAIYSAIFIPPKVDRGLYIGACPHCGAAMSATHYQTQVDCPSCAGDVAVRDSRFIALPRDTTGKAA